MSLRLKIPVNQLLQQMDSADLAEYIAFDLTQDSEWVDKAEKKNALDASRAMTQKQRGEAFMQALGKQ